MVSCTACVPRPPSTKGNFTSSWPLSLPLMSLTGSFIKLLFGRGRCGGRFSGSSGFRGGSSFTFSRRWRCLLDDSAPRKFLGFANHDVIALGTRNGALDEKDVVRLANLNYFQILGGAADLAH